MPQVSVEDDPTLISWAPVTGSDVTWNFEKFLLDKNGVPYKRYSYTTMPTDLIPDIDLLLSH